MPSSLTRTRDRWSRTFTPPIDRLMEAGEEVICLDNYFTGRKANIAQWIGHPRFELIRHDVTEPIKLEVIGSGTGLPGLSGALPVRPVKTAKTSFGTYNMLGLAGVGARCCWRAPVRSMAIRRFIPSRRATAAVWSRRHPQLLRRGQANRRDPVDYQRTSGVEEGDADFHTYGLECCPTMAAW